MPAAEPAPSPDANSATASANAPAPYVFQILQPPGAAPPTRHQYPQHDAAPDWHVPADLRVPWGWGDLGIFLVFYIGCTIALSFVAVLGGAAVLHMSLENLQKNSTLIISLSILAQGVASIGALLYFWGLMTVRRAGGFWRALGWRALGGIKTSPAVVITHLVAGVALALAVSVVSNFVGQPGPVPFEQFFQTRQTVLLLMGFGILVAPLVEETMFRGFLYPVVARRFGVATGVVATGCVFGAFHAFQLWGAWGQIALIACVGVILTWARARSHTVLAGYLLHVAYNSTLFAGLVIATKGLRDFSSLH